MTKGRTMSQLYASLWEITWAPIDDRLWTQLRDQSSALEWDILRNRIDRATIVEIQVSIEDQLAEELL